MLFSTYTEVLIVMVQAIYVCVISNLGILSSININYKHPILLK